MYSFSKQRFIHVSNGVSLVVQLLFGSLLLHKLRHSLNYVCNIIIITRYFSAVVRLYYLELQLHVTFARVIFFI